MLHGILALIVDTVASILAAVLLLRFWMQSIQVRPPMSVAQFTYQLSDWLVRPLRRILPGVGGYDWASLIAAYVVALLALLFDLWNVADYPVVSILLLSLLRLAQWVLYGLMGLLIIDAVFSWVNPHAPLAPFVRALTDPILRPLRRFIPLVGNIDLSPLVALILIQIGLQLVRMLMLSAA